MTSITIVTPWLGAHELIPGYRRAIEAAITEDDRLLIVDNASAPSLSEVWGAVSEWQTFLRNETNQGFSRACNKGLLEVETDAVLFLNNDICMTSVTWLEQIRKAIKPRTLVGARLRHDPHTAVDGQVIPYLDGWCIAGLTHEFKGLGGWSEDFEEPSYFGDNELCVRAQAAGIRLTQVPVGLRHISNYTSRRMDTDSVSARNRARYVAAVRQLLPLAA